MTPSTGIMNYLAGREKRYGIVVEQAEDEIAAINMAIGASFSRVRAMTGTAGGGFALMVEGLSLAAMTETPIVIALGQRPAPATGLPTRTEQGDLLFPSLHRMENSREWCLFPETLNRHSSLPTRHLNSLKNIRFQSFIIFDQYLGDAEWTSERMDLGKITFQITD